MDKAVGQTYESIQTDTYKNAILKNHDANMSNPGSATDTLHQYLPMFLSIIDFLTKQFSEFKI